MFTPRARFPKAVLFDAVAICKALFPTAVLFDPVVLKCKAVAPTDVLCWPVVVSAKALFPTAVFESPEVFNVKAFLPIAVLFPPVTAASKAFSPRTVLPATEFVPLPTVIEFMVASVVPVIAPVTSIPALKSWFNFDTIFESSMLNLAFGARSS